MKDSVTKIAGDKKARRFVTLDALRGAGAAAVMAFHAGPLLGGYSPPLAYLAVDMFFVLSGFVIAYAYDAKMSSGMSPFAFLQARVKRLYPIYLIGLLLGAASLYFNNPNELSRVGAAVSFFCGLFALPTPPMGAFRSLFPLNGPYWSLIFEFWIANLSFAFLWRVLQGRVLWAFVAFCAAILSAGVMYAKSIDLGWNWHSAPGGLARVCFSFYAGVLLARIHAKSPPRIRVPSSACLLAFCLLMVLPVSTFWKPVVGLVSVFLFFPALIYWGAEAIEKYPAVGAAFGDASYALYAIHRPLLYLFVWLLAAGGLSSMPKLYAIVTQIVVMAVIGILAWGIGKRFSAQRR